MQFKIGDKVKLKHGCRNYDDDDDNHSDYTEIYQNHKNDT